MTMSQVGVKGLEGVTSQIIFSHFNGDIGEDSDGNIEIKFVVKGQDGVVLKNSAILSKDGGELIGSTISEGSSLSESGT